MLYGCGGKEIKRVARSEPREKGEGERERRIVEEVEMEDSMYRIKGRENKG